MIKEFQARWELEYARVERCAEEAYLDARRGEDDPETPEIEVTHIWGNFKSYEAQRLLIKRFLQDLTSLHLSERCNEVHGE